MMFRLLTTGLLTTAFIGATAAQAGEIPTDKGSVLVGGTISFESSGGDLYDTNEVGRSTAFEISPSAGYFIAPHILVGGTLSFTGNGQGDISTSGWGIGPKVQYYFGETAPDAQGKIFPFVGAGYQYNSASSDDGIEETEEISATTSEIQFGGGIAWMATSSVAFTAEIRYDIDSFNSGIEDVEAVSGNQIKLLFGLGGFI